MTVRLQPGGPQGAKPRAEVVGGGFGRDPRAASLMVVVFDTSVFVAAARSRLSFGSPPGRGACFFAPLVSKLSPLF